MRILYVSLIYLQEGPSPHNCNLALKGILGLGAYAILLNETGQAQRATIYMNQAQQHGKID